MTIAVVSCGIIFLGILFTLFSFADTMFFRLAISKIAEGRISYEEWCAQPNRLRFGSGFRLYRTFRKR